MVKVTRKELAQIIGDMTLELGSSDIPKMMAEYLSGQSGVRVDLDSLMRDIMQYRLERGYVEATAVSAHELNNEAIEDIRALLKDYFPEAKSIIVNRRIDTDLVGGVRLDLPMESLDLSVRSKLNSLKELVAQERN